MARADVIMGSPAGGPAKSSQSCYLVVNTSGNSIYNFIYSQIDNSLYWEASYDGGLTWNNKVLIKSLSIGSGFAIWYDRWTPGDIGQIVHIAYFESGGDDVFYRSLNLTSEALGTETTIFAGASTGAVANTCISITKAIGGNLYCAFDIDGGTETGFYRSTDTGGTWGGRTNVNEPPHTDYYLLAPGFAADTQDIICIYWDRSASELSRKLYDDSGNSWGETSIATSMTSIASSTSASQFSISVDDANNKIILAAWSNRNTVNADLRFWSIDEISITEGTNVVLNSGGNQASCSLSLMVNSSTIYCFYVGKSDGSESIGSAANVYYKISSDGGTTWGSETKISKYARSYDFLYAAPLLLDSTGNFYAAYELQADIDEMLISVVLPAGVGGNSSILTGSVIH